MSPQDTRTSTPRYIGSGPYCYANCLAMMLADDTEPGLLEVLTGSPFGLQLLGGHRPLFDPVGWDPGIGMDAALALLGWTCERTGGGDAETALSRLRGALPNGPALVGPVEMGLLRHHPDAGEPIGADHYVVVIAVTTTWSASTTHTVIRTRPSPPVTSPPRGAPSPSGTPALAIRCAPACAGCGRWPRWTRCAHRCPRP